MIIFDLKKGEHRSEWYETMNPKHQIPCAQFNDGFLADSVVISKYLCKMSCSNLYPENAMKQAKIDEAIIDVTEPNFKGSYTQIFFWLDGTRLTDSMDSTPPGGQ